MPVHPDNSELLFHYTSPEGAYGILSSGQIWATDARFLNDSEELKHGSRLMSDAMKQRANDIDAGTYPITLPQASASPSIRCQVSEALRDLANNLDETPQEAAPFITCFCESGDLLSQWRGYAAGGYAIGFDRRKLAQSKIHSPLGGLAAPEPPHLTYAAYRGAYKRHVVDQLTTSLTDHVAGHGPFATRVQESEYLRDRVRPHVAYMKDQAFEEEREWRLIASSGRVRHRPATIGPVPFVEIDFPADAVRKIIVGPGPDRGLRMQTATDYAEFLSSGRSWIHVESSRVPYRG